MDNSSVSVKWMGYSFIAGLSLSASFYVLTVEQIIFSLFPLFSLFFSIAHLFTVYLKGEMDELNMQLGWITFLIGVFSYSAVLSTQYVELSSNILSITLTSILMVGFVFKIIIINKK